MTDVSKRITAKKLTVSHSMSLYLDQDQGGSSGVVFGLHKTEAVGKHIIGTRNTCFFFCFFFFFQIQRGQWRTCHEEVLNVYVFVLLQLKHSNVARRKHTNKRR